jgi:hypothetical protein
MKSFSKDPKKAKDSKGLSCVPKHSQEGADFGFMPARLDGMLNRRNQVVIPFQTELSSQRYLQGCCFLARVMEWQQRKPAPSRTPLNFVMGFEPFCDLVSDCLLLR